MKTTTTKTILNVFVTNLTAYVNGELIGEWLTLPASDEEINDLFERIGGDNNFTEYFITDFETDFGINVREYSNLYKLNELAQTIADFDEYDRNILEFLIINLGLESYTIEELTEKIDEVQIFSGCTEWSEVAEQYADETGLLDSIPDNLRYYFDFAAFGRDLSMDSTASDEIDGDFYVLW